MEKWLGRLLGFLLAWGKPETLAARINHIAHWYARRNSAKDTLLFLLQLDRRLYELQGTQAVRYGNGLHTKHRHMRYHDFFVARLKPDERVLDIGCGVGALAHSMAERAGAKVLGIEIDAGNHAKARAKYSHPNLEFVHGDALKDLPQQQFDVAVLSNVLEHIEHRPEFLRQAQNAAHPRRWLIRVPLFERDWRVPLKRELGVDYRLDPTHFTEYTLESFAEEMQQAGLTIAHLEVRWGEIWSELHSRGMDASDSA